MSWFSRFLGNPPKVNEWEKYFKDPEGYLAALERAIHSAIAREFPDNPNSEWSRTIKEPRDKNGLGFERTEFGARLKTLANRLRGGEYSTLFKSFDANESYIDKIYAKSLGTLEADLLADARNNLPELPPAVA